MAVTNVILISFLVNLTGKVNLLVLNPIHTIWLFLKLKLNLLYCTLSQHTHAIQDAKHIAQICILLEQVLEITKPIISDVISILKKCKHFPATVYIKVESIFSILFV